MVAKKASKRKKATRKKTAKRTARKVSPEKKFEKSIEQTVQVAAECCGKSSCTCGKSPCECGYSCRCRSKSNCGKHCGGMWFLGFVGAAVYYISTSTGFWNGVLGVLKALVWPAMLVFKLLGI